MKIIKKKLGPGRKKWYDSQLFIPDSFRWVLLQLPDNEQKKYNDQRYYQYREYFVGLYAPLNDCWVLTYWTQNKHQGKPCGRQFLMHTGFGPHVHPKRWRELTKSEYYYCCP